MPISRRTLLAAGLTLPSLLSCALRQAPQGIARLQGDVRINNAPAQPGQPTPPNSTLTTGSNSLAVLVIGADAFLVRENSEVRFDAALLSSPVQLAALTAAHDTLADAGANPVILEQPHGVRGFFLKAGRILAVFGPGPERTLHTMIAVAGIRGTGIYMEEENGRTYICACYGTTTLHPAWQTDTKQVITTRHHESPFFIYPQGATKPMEPAPMIHHTDEELVMLEALHNRRPPFHDPLNPGNHY